MESSTKPSNQQTSLSVIPETPKADIREQGLYSDKFVEQLLVYNSDCMLLQGRKRQKQSKKSTKRRRTRVLAMDSDSGEGISLSVEVCCAVLALYLAAR